MASVFCSINDLQSPPTRASSPSHCSRGGIGRRVRLRSAWGNSWRFKSSREHHFDFRFSIFDFRTIAFGIETHRQQDPQFIRRTFAGIARRYDLANHALSLGIDFLWRAWAARIVAEWAPRRVLDLATGSGDLAQAIRGRCPNARVVGADFCEPMLREAQRKGVQDLLAADGTRLPFRDSVFDALTVAFGLRNMASWETALREMARVIRTGGHVLVMDFSLPQAAFLRVPYRLYLHHVLPRVAGALTGRKDAYEYLGESIEGFPRGRAMLALMESCGFELAAARPLCGGIATIYTATRQAGK